MIKNIVITVSLVAALVAGGCAKEQPAADDECLDVVRTNLKTAQEENIEAYMAAIHPESPSYQQTRELMERLFREFDLKYELVEVKLLAKTEDEAKVQFTQETRKVSGPEFKDNKVTGVHLLKKSDGQWKIMSTEIKEVEYLEPQKSEPEKSKPAETKPMETPPEPPQPVETAPEETAPTEPAPIEPAPTPPAEAAPAP